jgi:hypothetical protein
LQNSPLESTFFVALIENYSTSKPLNFSPEKSQIMSSGTAVANGGYVLSTPIYVERNKIKFLAK